MPRAGELTYYQQIGEEGRYATVRKPFSLGQHASSATCGAYLLAFGGVCELLRPSPSRLLDLGCGTGWTSVLFAKMGYEVLGQDVAIDAIRMARDLRAEERIDNVSFRASDYESLEYDNEFDNAVFFDSLHHAVDERAALASAYRALRPNGVCVMREPGYGHAQADHSQLAMDRYDVTEKDMPPVHIADLALSIGFRQVNVVPFPDQVFRNLSRVPTAHIARRRSGPIAWLSGLCAAVVAGVRVGRVHQRMFRRGGLVQLIK